MPAVKAAGKVTVTYNSNALTNYCNTAEIAAAIAELDTTNLGSTAMTYIPGLADWTINLTGNWDATIDGFLMPDVVTPPTTLRTCVVTVNDGTTTATYTWTTSAFVTGITIGGASTEKVGLSGVSIRCSGAPTRTTS